MSPTGSATGTACPSCGGNEWGASRGAAGPRERRPQNAGQVAQSGIHATAFVVDRAPSLRTWSSQPPSSASIAEDPFGSRPPAPPEDHVATEPFGLGSPSVQILPFDSAVVGAPAEFVGEQQEHPVGQPFATLEELEATLHIDLSGILDTACLDAPGDRRTNADDLGKVR